VELSPAHPIAGLQTQLASIFLMLPGASVARQPFVRGANLAAARGLKTIPQSRGIPWPLPLFARRATRQP
jgi:hypothetical protein